jgi:L-2-hydroxyglutarate oxidase LhgO
MVYPVPDPDLPFLGVHITRHIDGSVSLGPTAMVSLARDGYGAWEFRISDLWSIATWPGSWRVLGGFWKTALSELRYRMSRKAFVAACAEFMPSIDRIPLKKKATAGVRAQAVGRNGEMADDFIISESDGIAHVRNAPSPAATSSLAISRYLVDRLDTQIMALVD